VVKTTPSAFWMDCSGPSDGKSLDDELLEICDAISVSAGIRRLQILLAPKDYIHAVRAKTAPIARRGNSR
jgi:hypothetical protein